jgi:hypothetical protein
MDSDEQSYKEDPAWARHVKAVKIRESAVKDVADSLVKRKFVAANEIASTDIFVQKAENELLIRSKGMALKANRCLGMFILFAITFILTFVCARSFFEIEISAYPTQSLIKGIIKNATVIGIFLGVQYLLISLYRAFLHEATTLENRIHSLRLGRLYIYLKYSSIKDSEMSDVRNSISAAELEKVLDGI